MLAPLLAETVQAKDFQRAAELQKIKGGTEGRAVATPARASPPGTITPARASPPWTITSFKQHQGAMPDPRAFGASPRGSLIKFLHRREEKASTSPAKEAPNQQLVAKLVVVVAKLVVKLVAKGVLPNPTLPQECKTLKQCISLTSTVTFFAPRLTESRWQHYNSFPSASNTPSQV